MFSCSGHIDDLYDPGDINEMIISIYGEPLTKIVEEHPLPKGFQYEVYNEPRPFNDILPRGRLIIKSPEPMTMSVIRKNLNFYTSKPWVRIQKRNDTIQSLMRWLIKNEEEISVGMNERIDFLKSLPLADTIEYPDS